MPTQTPKKKRLHFSLKAQLRRELITQMKSRTVQQKQPVITTLRLKTNFCHVRENEPDIHLQQVLKVKGSDLHLCSLSRVVTTHPRTPVDAIVIGFVRPMVIIAIQVGNDAWVEPPSSHYSRSTVPRIVIIVAIFRWKPWVTVIAQGITSSSWKKKNTENKWKKQTNKQSD